MVDLDIQWISPAVVGAIRGLLDSIDVAMMFGDYVALKLTRRVLCDETLASELGAPIYLSTLFVLRGPPGAILVRRDPLAIKLDDKAPETPKALLGIRTLADGSPRIVLNLENRKNPRRYSPLTSPFF